MGIKGTAKAIVLIVAVVLMVTLPQASGRVFAASTRVHIVRPGESLSSIAAMYGVTVSAIQQENGIADPNFVYAGQRLRIPNGGGSSQYVPSRPRATAVPPTTGNVPSHSSRTGSTYYIVRPGDTLYKISLMFGVSVVEIIRANNLRSSFIWAGQRLLIPGGYRGRGRPSYPTAVPTTGVPPGNPYQTPTRPTRGSTYRGPTFYYVVRPGDTLSGLAIRFHTSVADIKSLNGLTSNWLYVGQRIKVPGAGSSPSVPALPRPTFSAPTRTAPPTAVAPPPTSPPPTATPVPIPTATPMPVAPPTPTPTFDKPKSPYDLSGG